jgi:hypothetical protein
MPRVLDLSFARFPRVPDFVIQYIRDQDLDEEQYVDGQTLIQLCLDEFCEAAERRDRQSMKNAKDDVVASVKRMVAEGVLLFKRGPKNEALFRLPVEQLAESPSTIIVEQRDRDAEEAETSLLEDDPTEGSEADREFPVTVYHSNLTSYRPCCGVCRDDSRSETFGRTSRR